jgi:hypothetical protein
MKFCIAFLAVCSLATHGAYAAWHDRYAGTGIRVHHVQLSGHGGDNTIALRNLAVTYEACVQRNISMGRPSQSIPASGLPALVTAFEIDMYYASNRTLEVKKSLHHSIDVVSCALEAKESTILTFFSSAGKCDVDVAKKTASGQCDLQQHAKSAVLKANESTISISTEQALGKIDLSYLPPEQRAKVEASLKSLKTATQVSDNPANNMEVKKMIAGHLCSTYRDVGLNVERCLAQPNRQTVSDLNPFPIPPATLNGYKPGVLLEIKSLALTVTAKSVNYSLSVSPDLFSLPTDYKLSAPAGGRS